ncbi:MAG: hypothetical protein HQL35_10130, partial [Alphaproteobacteria bacterium]|nr:hypothetical protein [Alphaproteobacteria bacterium]
RLEGLISGWSVEQVSERAIEIVNHGASGVMIHTKDATADQVLACYDLILKKAPKTLLMMVPQNIPDISMTQWFHHGCSIVVYPNQMLRASIHSQRRVLQQMGRGVSLGELADSVVPIRELLDIEKTFNDRTK